ncbi:hypothetical protein KY362_00945 [Candidatus Woesearchaeota archaeon]|nr:hypothetical protein [Candidatus Woesearchaeota archaeon]
MRPLKLFEEFLEEGTVTKRAADAARARSLVEEADRRMKFLQDILNKIGMTDENANYFIENSYDLLISMIRAKLLLDGYHSSGEGAHEAEVAYMRELEFSENDARFMNDLRYYRNGILYYGKEFDKDYGDKVLVFMEKVYPALKILCSEKPKRPQ